MTTRRIKELEALILKSAMDDEEFEDLEEEVEDLGYNRVEFGKALLKVRRVAEDEVKRGRT